MKANLLTFVISPRPATEGKSIKISFSYRTDKTTLTLAIVDAEEQVTKYITVEVRAGQGSTEFVIPKGWGPVLFVNHKDFISGAITVNP